MMKKYLTIIKTYWQRALTYRFTILAYRIGEVVEVVVIILMWSAIYGDQKIISGFTFQEMITYILVGNLFSAATRNFLPEHMNRDIKDGGLSAFLVKPMSYLSYVFFREIGRSSFVIIMSLGTQGFVILFFLKSFVFNLEILYLLLIAVMVILAFITQLFLSYLIGIIALWTDEVDGLYATYERLKKFFSGGYFPLSLLPAAFVSISYFLPFGYSFFVPAQLYLKKADLALGVRGILIQIIWIVVLYGIIKIVWKKGLRRYEGVGM